MTMISLPRKNKGITLMELMIVVAIVSILASVSFSQYAAYGERARRAEARAALLDAAALQERYYSDNNQFAALATVGISTSTENNYYTLSMSLDDANNQSFTLTATPANADADCTTLTFTNAGAKGFTGSGDLNTCWGR